MGEDAEEGYGGDSGMTSEVGHCHHCTLVNAKKPDLIRIGLIDELIWATSYSPTHSRVQYHRG